MPVDLGDLLPDLGTTVTDNSTGALANASTVTLTLTLPDGSSLVSPTTITVTNPSTGVYRASYETTQAGMHRARWVADGSNCDGAYEQSWHVESTPTGGLVSVDDALAHLGSPTLSSAQTEQLRATILAATRVCGSYIGRTLARESATEVYSGGKGAIALRRTPVISVTSVTESGTALTGSDWVLDTVGWLLHRGSTTSASRWAAGRANVSVTYVAGYADPPADVRLAVLREVEHLWQRTQQAPHPALAAEAFDEFMMRDGSSPSRLVRTLLDPHKAVGIA
jgi:hypothetical protein